MASLAGAFGGILAYGIGFMRNVADLAGWYVITLLVTFEPILRTSQEMDLHHRGNTDSRCCARFLLVCKSLKGRSHSEKSERALDCAESMLNARLSET